MWKNRLDPDFDRPDRKALSGWLGCALLLGLILCGPGCTSIPGLSSRSRQHDADALQLVANDEVSASNIQGPTERALNVLSWKRRQEEIKSNPQSNMGPDLQRYEDAVAVYDSGDFHRAEQLFKELAKDRRRTYESFGTRWRRWWGMEGTEDYDPFKNFGDPIEEDALFMLGESQYSQERFAHAQDSYDDLLNRYPSTRHLDHVTKQLFRIARYWLDFPEDVNSQGEAEIKLAGNEELTGEAIKFKEHSTVRQMALVPNLTDKSRPLFDTYGRGLQALRSIWLHDATGPLADDALMLSANYHLRAGNYEDAARDYKLLRENYPDSPHFKDAYILGSHVTFASYQGAAYDGHALQEARELKQTALQMFNDLPPEQRQRMQEELELLQVAEEARLWDKVEFYEAKGTPESIALYCNLIINRHPNSPFADKARMKLNELAYEREQEARGSWWNPLAQPRRPSPTETGEPIADVREPYQPPARLSLPSETSPLAEPSATDEQPRKPGFLGRIGGMLRRPEQTPDLQPVPSGADEATGRTGL